MKDSPVLEKVEGKRITYVFTNNARLHIFNVQTLDLSGAWYRITDGNGRQFVVDPAKVLYSYNEVVA